MEFSRETTAKLLEKARSHKILIFQSKRLSYIQSIKYMFIESSSVLNYRVRGVMLQFWQKNHPLEH